MNLEKTEELLYIALVESLVEKYFENEDTRWHMWVTTFGTILSTLIELECVDDCTLIVKKENIATHLSLLDIPSKPTFLRVLATWMDYFVQYTPLDLPALPDTRNIFTAHDYYHNILDYLFKLGYVDKLEDYYEWTDKIAPIMRVLTAWNVNNQCLSDAGAEGHVEIGYVEDL